MGINELGNVTGLGKRLSDESEFDLPEVREICFEQIPQMTPLVKLRFGDSEYLATVDTGAQISILNERVHNALANKPNLIEPVRLRMAGRDCYMPSYLSSPVGFKMGDTEFKHPFLIAPIHDDIILGMDVLGPQGIRIDFGKNELQLRKENVPIELLKDKVGKQRRVSRVVLSNRVRVPPNSELLVSARTTLVGGGDVMFEGRGRLKGLLAPNLVTKADKDILVNLTNAYDTPRFLKKGTFLGFASDFDEMDESEQDPSVGDNAKVRQNKVAEVVDATNMSDTQLNMAVLELRVAPHLRTLFRESCQHLTLEQAQSLVAFFIEFEPVFARDDTDLGCFTEIMHKIDTGDSPPVRELMRRTPRQFQGEEEKTLKSMLEHGVIRESNSEWASAPVLVRKRDGSVRYCIDYRKLNNVTRKDAFPLPRIQECLDSLSGNIFFSSLDLQSGYWQLLVDPADIHKTAFITKHGLFEHVRMPFGLTNSPATFNRAMQLVLRGLS